MPLLIREHQRKYYVDLKLVGKGPGVFLMARPFSLRAPYLTINVAKNMR